MIRKTGDMGCTRTRDRGGDQAGHRAHRQGNDQRRRCHKPPRDYRAVTVRIALVLVAGTVPVGVVPLSTAARDTPTLDAAELPSSRTALERRLASAPSSPPATSAGTLPSAMLDPRLPGTANAWPGSRPAGREADTGSPFAWPLNPEPEVTRSFEAPANPYGPGHRGVDLAAAPGQEALAAAAGVVVFAGTVAGRAVVSIDHDGGLRTTYEPVTSSLAAGDHLHRGQVIGTVTTGHPGCAAPACLHWGVRRGHEYLNPLQLVRTDASIRLKPWDG